MAHAQRQAIQSALQQSGYNLSKAAILLRIGRTTLYRLIEQYDIEVDEDARRANAATRRRTVSAAPARVTLIDGNWYLVKRQDSSVAAGRV
jgi:hypothetical protein